jgi:hypothetical protein
VSAPEAREQNAGLNQVIKIGKKKFFESVAVLETTLKKQNSIHGDIKNRLN